MEHHASKGRLLGAILLIAGTTVGAGVLALPVASGRAGFALSIVTMVAVWLYLTYAAFCLLEVNLAVEPKSNLLSMATQTLGRLGKVVSWSAYLFLLYALNTAYIAASSGIMQYLSQKIFGVQVGALAALLPLLIVFALILHQGLKMIDTINRFMMAGLVISFVVLVLLSCSLIKQENLTVVAPEYIMASISTILTAFGFHIVIPSLVTYLNHDVKALKKAIWIGSGLPLVAYIAWQIAILGLVPASGDTLSIEMAYAKGLSGTDLLQQMSQLPLVSALATSFALFAILTSFLGVSLSLFDFLADALKIEKGAKNKWMLFFFTLVPPLLFALTSSKVFFAALEYAGAYGVVILLALLPAVMVWKKRYSLKLSSPYKVYGGKVLLGLFIMTSLCIIIAETLRKLELV